MSELYFYDICSDYSLERISEDEYWERITPGSKSIPFGDSGFIELDLHGDAYLLRSCVEADPFEVESFCEELEG